MRHSPQPVLVTKQGKMDNVLQLKKKQLLIILYRKIWDWVGRLQRQMAEVLKGDADVINKTLKIDLVIRNVVETTTKYEVRGGPITNGQ